MDANHSSPQSRGRSGAQDAPEETEGAAERVVELVAGDFLLTLNPVDGSQIEPCPPSRRPISPRRFPEIADVFSGPAHPPLLEREEERERLTRLIGRGRSVRLTGPSGTGRTALLAAVARECGDLAPDGVIRLSGHRRTLTDLKHELYAAIHLAGGYRPGPAELHTALREIGAVVIVDDIEFGGSALDELLDATPECAYLISATPGTPAPAGESRMEEVFLAGISRTGCLELLEQLVERPLTDAEADWAADLWFACEGLPLRFVQAGTLLRQRDHQIGGLDAPALATIRSPALSLVTDGGLTEAAREMLRVAFALGGELPGLNQLPALTADNDAATAQALLADAGLITRSGDNYRLAAGVAEDLAGAGFAEGAAGRALTAAQHYTWWLGQLSPAAVAARDDSGEDGGGVAAEIAAETGVLLAVVQAAQRAGHGSAVSALARTAAGLLAATLRWSAWERVLRTGQEAARAAGLVADQAYFHHELGVLAICQGQPDRARAELEASIALRSVLADNGGVHAGRRALVLAEDLSRPALPAGTSGAARPAALPPGTGGADGAAPGAEPTGGTPGAEDVTELLEPVHGPFPGPDADPDAADGGRRPGLKGLAVTGTRRNAAAAGAGALLLAVLGAVVTLGLTSQDAEAPTDDTLPGPTLTDPDDDAQDDGMTGDASDSSTSRPPSDTAEPSESEETTDGETAGSDDSDGGTATTGTSGTSGGTGGGSTDGGSSSTAGSSSSTSGGSDSGSTSTPTPPGTPTTGSPTTTGGSGDPGGTGTGSDGGTDAGADGGTDEGADGGTDEGAGGGTDAGADGGTDAGADGGTDEGADGGTDEGADGGADGGTDEGSEGGTTVSSGPSPDPTDSGEPALV
ncbi:ATP-binding protein [Streptomyces aidingensis]|uniref:Uncharacterized protein n=1 Tax=Streptomyces aidingensis TaxID=910347 RepID=A0A1I1SV44_9ACTN|nr:ATP-binding protein [Streptomyces aidingensis]SFD50212.1 hypothetical protein SAMN05421773_11756 [Streptomyces aidingensis]